MQNIRFIKNENLKTKPTDESSLGFGRLFSDYMFTMDYTVEKGWDDPRVEPYHCFEMDPATLVLHYGQTIFEGMKCYKRADGGLQLFRAEDNFKRMNISAERLSIPEFDVELVMAGLKKLIEVEKGWVPSLEGTSLYIRPVIIATDPYIGVRASHNYTFYIILSPVGAYYPRGIAPVGIYVEDVYVRAVRGGIGFAKTAGNYAASIKAGELAKKKGFDQVMWLDGVEQKYVEEVGTTNMMFVIDGVLVTPELNGSILAGITRDSILKLAREMGMKVEERKIEIAEVYEAHKSGKLSEVFATGTAAVVSPVGEISWDGDVIKINDGKIGSVAQKMYDTIISIQYGKTPDTHGWIVKID